jgi:hypothetical protein
MYSSFQPSRVMTLSLAGEATKRLPSLGGIALQPVAQARHRQGPAQRLRGQRIEVGAVSGWLAAFLQRGRAA